MLFKKKTNKLKCINCTEKIDKEFSFCPYCGIRTKDDIDELQEYGMIGRTDIHQNPTQIDPLGGILNSLVSSLIKNIQVNVQQIDPLEMQNSPNGGIKIRIGNNSPQKKKVQRVKTKEMSEEQLDKLSKFPRTTAKTNVKRLGDKVVYELSAPGIQSTEDVFVSKLESGYEVKAIGKNKIYVNSLPITLPIKSYSIDNKGLVVEFSLHEQ